MTIALAHDRESLDALAWRVAGRTDLVDAILAQTPALGPIAAALPEGTAVTIPDLPQAASPSLDLVQLWD